MSNIGCIDITHIKTSKQNRFLKKKQADVFKTLTTHKNWGVQEKPKLPLLRKLHCLDYIATYKLLLLLMQSCEKSPQKIAMHKESDLCKYLLRSVFDYLKMISTTCCQFSLWWASSYVSCSNTYTSFLPEQPIMHLFMSKIISNKNYQGLHLKYILKNITELHWIRMQRTIEN